MFFAFCSKREVKINAEKTENKIDKKYLKLVKIGDSFFNKKHLYGWRRAFGYYLEAYKKKGEKALKRKLFFTLALLMIREKEENILVKKDVYFLVELNFKPESEKEKVIYSLIQLKSKSFMERKNSTKKFDFLKISFNKTIFDLENSDIDAYFYLALLKQNFNYDEYTKNFKILSVKYKNSPLFIYLNNFNYPEIEKRFPFFAEYFVFKANRLFKTGHSSQALKYFNKAVSLVKDYPRAYIGMASVWFFSYENFLKALDYYKKTLVYDPINPTALLGKAVCFQKLGKYRESDISLDDLLKKQALYHGEAYYYKAYNRFFEKDLLEAKKYVELSKLYIPDSGDLNFLSGLINIKTKEYRKAKKDFLKSLEDSDFKKCEPYYFVGKINFYIKKRGVKSYFKKYILCKKNKLIHLVKAYHSLKKKKNLSFDEKINIKKIKKAILKEKRSSELYLKDIFKILKGSGNSSGIKSMAEDLINSFRKVVKSLNPKVNS